MPSEISGSINFSENNISSLEGSPHIVKGSFDCSANNLSYLKNSPKIIQGSFNCSLNDLINLSNGPKTVQKDYICFSNSFNKIEEVSEELGGDLITDIIIDDVQRINGTVKGTFNYSGKDILDKLAILGSHLTSKEDIQDWLETHEITGFTILPNCAVNVDGNVNLAEKLSTIKRLPVKFNEVRGTFDVSGNELTSLEGSPSSVKGDFLAFKNRVISLKGCPKKVGGNFVILKNNITSLEYSPSYVDGDFICSYNPLKSFQGLGTVLGAVFANILISELEYQKYLYNNMATYKYAGVALCKFIKEKISSISEEDRIFDNNKKNLFSAISKMIETNSLKREMINDILLENLTKYGLTELKQRVLEIKNPKKEQEKAELTEEEILRMAFETAL